MAFDSAGDAFDAMVATALVAVEGVAPSALVSWSDTDPNAGLGSACDEAYPHQCLDRPRRARYLRPGKSDSPMQRLSRPDHDSGPASMADSNGY